MARATGEQLGVMKVTPAFPTHQFRPRDRTALRRRLGLPETDKIILVGPASVEKQRGGGELAELKRAFGGERGITLLLGGSSNDQTCGLPNAISTGSIENDDVKADWVGAADILVAAGSGPMAGRWAIEAALCGVPSVGYRHSGLELAVIHGVSGILVEQGGLGGLEAAIRRLLADDASREALGGWGRATFAASHSYASGYHSIHRAFIELGLLQAWRDQVSIRFQPAIANVWSSAGHDGLAREAYRLPVINGRMIVSESPARLRRLHLAMRDVAAWLFPKARPIWLRRARDLYESIYGPLH
jgi:hypothetical protein